MTKSWQHLGIAVILALGGAFTATSVLAQSITIDGTLSPAQTLTGPNYTIPQSVGQTVGSNLFHSFGIFNLNAGERANFGSAADIRNIFSRVTGGSRSLIDGLIFTNSANVNLFLINPSGIVFGPNARLDVGGSTRGSFIATTVDALVWSNGSQFSATNPGGASSLLTIVGDPSGFLSTLRTPPPIDVNRSTLRVSEGQSLLLLGGNVNLARSNLSVDFIEGGRIELGAVAEPGNVGLNTNGNILSLNFPQNLARGDVSLTNRASLDTRAGNSGSIAINARNIDILGGSGLLAGISSGLGTVDSQAGDVRLNAIESINLSSGSFIDNSVLARSVGKGGDINITTGSLFLTNGSQINTTTFGQGVAGTVNINARDTVSFNGVSEDGFFASGVINQVFNGASGKGGDINITTGSLSLTNGARLNTSTFGQGDAGNVNINARDLVSFDGGSGTRLSGILSGVGTQEAQGNGGNINITTGSLSLTNGGQITASTDGKGNAGNVTIQARDAVSSNGNFGRFDSGVFTDVGSTASGNGGDIKISAASLSLQNGTQLVTGTAGIGNAGNVKINVRDNVFINGVGSNGKSSAIFSNVESPEAIGNGGSIDISTRTVLVTNGAVITTSTRGKGDAGNIIVNANTLGAFNGGQLISNSRSNGKAGNITLNVTDQITFSGSDRQFNTRLAQFTKDIFELADPASGVFASTVENSTGQGGNITISTGELNIQDSAKVTVSSAGSGNAGNINIFARSIKLDNAGITARTAATNGGNITLQDSDLLLIRRGGQISTTAGTALAGGNGGNINIDAGFIVALPQENSDITANAFSGNGGTITIDAKGIFGIQLRQQPTPESDITASSTGGGINGVVDINTLDIDPNRGFINLPTNVVDTFRLVAQSCSAFGKGGSEFTVTGRGGLPPSPDDFLSSDVVWSDTRLTALPVSTNSRITPQVRKTADGMAIIPATGWVFDEKKGEVTLIAANGNSEGLDSNQVKCIVP